MAGTYNEASGTEERYNSPETQVVPEQKPAAGNLTETMILFLKEASPWLRFLGILGFVGSGFCVLFALLFAIFSNSIINELIGSFGNTPVWLASVFYVATGAVLFFIARFTYRFGSFIRRYLYSNAEEDLEQAFRNNKSLWKLSGIISIISLSLIPVIIIVSVAIGLAASGLF